MYLKAYYLLDITTGNGNQITPVAFKCERDRHQTSKIQWQYQPKPSGMMVEAWQKMLSTVYINHGTTLKEPLKEWIGPTHMTFAALINKEENIVFVPDGTRWKKYSRIGRRSQHKIIHEFVGNENSILVDLSSTTITNINSNNIY